MGRPDLPGPVRRRLRLGLLRVAWSVAAAVVLAAGALALQLYASVPQLEGRARAAGAARRVEVARDEHGVPHVFAATEADAYFGLGFAHGQDRFVQMDLTRRAVWGRLSELAGRGALQRDIRARIYGLGQLARIHARSYPPAVRDAVEAYTRGVNAGLGASARAPEYVFLAAAPEPWTVEDTAAIAVAMMDDLVGGFEEELDRAELRRFLSPKQLDEFLGNYPSWAPRSLHGTAPADVAGASSEHHALDTRPHGGSNAWAVDGKHTKTGKPLLANDPHLALSYWSPFYLARLVHPGGVLVGASLPGFPFIVIGHNGRLAWTNTVNPVDAEDLSVAPPLSAPDVRSRTETIRVREGPLDFAEEKLVVYSTPSGPILEPSFFPRLSERRVLRSLALEHDNGIASALHGMQSASDLQSFFVAAETWASPLTAMVVASTDGDIGLLTTGRIPLRDTAGRWNGAIPASATPRSLNPPGGMLVAANNLIPARDYPHPMPGHYSSFRAARIVEVLHQRGSAELEGARQLQRDSKSTFARRALDALLGQTQPSSARGREARALLAAWNAEMLATRSEPLIFTAWMVELGRAVYADELDYESFERYSRRYEFLDAVVTGELAHWCDIQGTNRKETCSELAGPALDRAMTLLSSPGSSLKDLTWGAVHQAVFEHPLLASLPIIGAHFAPGVPANGDVSTVNAGQGSPRTLEKRAGASLRVVFDLSDLNRSRFELAPGQSGNFLSEHCGDLVDDWSSGDGFEIRTDWDAESPPEGARVLTLDP